MSFFAPNASISICQCDIFFVFFAVFPDLLKFLFTKPRTSFLKECLSMYIFSRRFSSEKSPTITVTSFFCFFCQTTDLIVYVPLFSIDFTRFTGNPAVTGSSPCFSQKPFRAFAKADETEGSPLSIFFRHCATFFDFFSSKGSHLQDFFDILQQTKVPNSPKGLPFYVFRHYETVQNSHFSFFFSKIKKLNFLSPKGPFQFI